MVITEIVRVGSKWVEIHKTMKLMLQVSSLLPFSKKSLALREHNTVKVSGDDTAKCAK